MRITIDLGVASDDAAHRWLDDLLRGVEDGWHLWDVSADACFEDTTWVKDRGTAGGDVVELYRAALRRGEWDGALHGRALNVVARPRGNDELRPRDAAHFASKPLVVLVENRITDGAFLERVVAELDPTLRHWWQLEPSPVRLDSLGGTGQMAKHLCTLTRGASIRPRLVVVVDSDRRAPGAAPAKQAGRIQRVCAEKGVPCWVLAKREAENYLPQPLLAARPDAGPRHAAVLDAWRRLGDDQRDYYDMKRGLPRDTACDAGGLFDRLDDADRAALAHGFGEAVWKCWSVGPAGQAKRALLARGGGDLERGLALIRQEV